MATKLQYDIFRAQYDEEMVRRRDLRETAKAFLGVCTFLIGGLIFKIKDFIQGESLLIVFLFLVGCIFLLLAIAILLAALGIRRYETLFSPVDLVKKMENTPLNDEAFLDDRIIDVAVAWERNSYQNYKKAILIAVASVFLICGGALVLLGTVFSSVM